MNEREEHTIIIAQQQIKLPLSCVHCKTWYPATITVVKNTCPNCHKEFEKDISEDEKTYGLEILKTVCFIMLKELQTNDEVIIQAKDRYLQNVEQLITLFKPLGIIVKSNDITTMADNRTGKKMTINRFVMTKHEQLTYHFGTPKN